MKHDQPYPFSFDLHFTDDPLLGSSAHIVLRCYSKDEAGTTFITPDCATPEELSYQISRLQSELEVNRDRGLRQFVKSINRNERKRSKK